MAEYIKRLDALRIVNLFHGAKNAYHRICDIPAADVAPVVRCRDCKHFLEKGGILEPWCDWHEASLFDGDGFCSEGERKYGDGNG